MKAIARPDIVPGGMFPDYELRDHAGANRRLSDLQGADPMVLVLSRGSFCPKDREQHRLLAAMEPEFKVAYTKIVTISTDTLMEANEMRDGVGPAATAAVRPGHRGRARRQPADAGGALARRPSRNFCEGAGAVALPP